MTYIIEVHSNINKDFYSQENIKRDNELTSQEMGIFQDKIEDIVKFLKYNGSFEIRKLHDLNLAGKAQQGTPNWVALSDIYFDAAKETPCCGTMTLCHEIYHLKQTNFTRDVTSLFNMWLNKPTKWAYDPVEQEAAFMGVLYHYQLINKLDIPFLEIVQRFKDFELKRKVETEIAKKMRRNNLMIADKFLSGKLIL